MRIVKKYTGCRCWRQCLRLDGGLANRLSGRTNVAQHGIGGRGSPSEREPITLENPVILYKNEPYVPLKIVERLGGTTDGKNLHTAR